jgi:SET domain-containing protein
LVAVGRRSPGAFDSQEALEVPNLSYLSPKTVVKESPIHGRGLFASEPIAKGEIVAIKGGYVFDLRTRRHVAKRLGPAEIPIADSYFIGPLAEHEREGAMLFSNHSCEPNIGIQGQIVFVAMRDIQSGEELSHDWATTDDDTYEMQCHCGAHHCRGIITGQDWRRKDLQEKYRGYMAWYLQRKIDQGE